MKTFFRIQTKGISLSDMQAHKSADGGSENEVHDGLCATETVSELRSYIRSFADGIDLNDEFEVVIVRGRRVGKVYDGVLIYPEEIIERVSVREFFTDDRFCDYEDCW
jgi:hypothetical protein